MLEFNAADVYALKGKEHYIDMQDCEDFCRWANKKLAEYLAKQPTVYQYKGHRADWSHEIDEAFGGRKEYTHRAILVNVEKIEGK